MSGDGQEVDERVLREADDAITAEVESWADAQAAHSAEIATRMKHCIAALRVAGVPLTCETSEALRELADAIQAIIHEALDE